MIRDTGYRLLASGIGGWGNLDVRSFTLGSASNVKDAAHLICDACPQPPGQTLPFHEGGETTNYHFKLVIMAKSAMV